MVKDHRLIELEIDCFSSNVAQNIYKALRVIYKANIEPTLGNIYLESSKYDSNITREKIETIINIDADIDSFDFYVQQLKMFHEKEKLKTETVRQIMVEVDKNNSPDLKKIRGLFQTGLKQVNEIIQPNANLKNMKDLYENFDHTLKGRLDGSLFNSTGSWLLDEALGNGFPIGEIALLFARPSIGKSAFASYLINNMINLRIPVIYVTLEMSEISSFQRLLSLRTGVPYFEWYNMQKDQDLYDYHKNTLDAEYERLKSINTFRLVENPYLGLDDIREMVRDFKETLGLDHVTVVVDQLKMLKDFKKISTEHTAIEYAIDDTNALCKEENISLLGLHQANRSTEGDKKIKDEDQINSLRPQVANLKSSGALEERARVVIGLHRPYYYYERYFPDMLELQQNIIEAQILKNTHGESGRIIKYLFQPKVFNFLPYIDPEDTDEQTL
jgi:replicative DNA helicase